MNKNAKLFLKLLFTSIVVAVMASSVCAQRPEVRAGDDLVFASTDALRLRYDKLVAQNLYKAPFDFGRAVVYPPFEGEFVLAIYSAAGNADLAVVALVTAQKNIWYAASRLDQDLRINPNVSVKTVKVTIKRRVALAVAEAIGYAVARTRPSVPTERVTVDGTRILFFAPAHAKTKIRSAELDPMSEGDLSQALRRLVNLLEKYCSSSDAARQQISMEIEGQARLISRIR
jgi:hypothetical protein